MANVVLRSLVFVVGLLTALPPGWCCRFGLPPTCSQALTKKAGATSLTPCCHHGRPKSEPSPPPQSPSCCCVAQDTTKPAAPEKVDLDPVCLGFADFATPRSTAVMAADVVLFNHPPESPPRNVLHCVWLC